MNKESFFGKTIKEIIVSGTFVIVQFEDGSKFEINACSDGTLNFRGYESK